MTVPAGILDRVLGAPMSAAHPSGLLTAEDYAAARRQGLLGLGTGLLAASGGGPYQNLNQRLAQGIQSGQQAYQQGLQQQAQQAQAGQAYDFNQLKMQGAQQDMAAQQRIAEGRARIIQQNPMPDQSNPQAMAAWIDKVLPQFIMLGDTDTLGKLSEIRKSLGGSVATANLGDRMQFYNPQTGAVIREAPIAASPNTMMVGERFTPATQARVTGQIASSFRLSTKKEEDSQAKWAQMDQIRQRAATGLGAPDDLIGLVDVMSALYNPGAVVRVGTVQITMKKLGSWKQKLQNWKAQGLTGAPDPELVRLIAAAASKIAEEHMLQYEDKRQRHLAWGERYGIDMNPILPDVWHVGSASDPADVGAGTPAVPEFDPSKYGFGVPK